jgi:hypothetical protein
LGYAIRPPRLNPRKTAEPVRGSERHGDLTWSHSSRSHNSDLKNLPAPNTPSLFVIPDPTLREHLGPSNCLGLSFALPKDPVREQALILAAKMRPKSGGPVSAGGRNMPALPQMATQVALTWGQSPAPGVCGL